MGWPGTETSAEERHPKGTLRLLGGSWDWCPPWSEWESPQPGGEGPTRSSCSPWVVPRQRGAEPRSGSRLGKHRQSRACSAPRSLTPPHPQRGKNAEEKGKKMNREEGREGVNPSWRAASLPSWRNLGREAGCPRGALPRERGLGHRVRGAAGSPGGGRHRSLLPATGPRRVTCVGLNTRVSVGVGVGRGGRSHHGAHGDTYDSAGGSKAGARSRPRVSVGLQCVWGSRLQGSSSHPSAPRGCLGAGSKKP